MVATYLDVRLRWRHGTQLFPLYHQMLLLDGVRCDLGWPFATLGLARALFLCPDDALARLEATLSGAVDDHGRGGGTSGDVGSALRRNP